MSDLVSRMVLPTIGREDNDFLRVIDSISCPFPIKRVFWVVAGHGARRGKHAHIACRQLLVCIAGQIKVTLKDGLSKQQTFLLGPHSDAVIIDAGIWAEQFYDSDSSILLVLCDQEYQEDDYLRSWDEYLKWKAQ